jgi:hypothetical protein
LKGARQSFIPFGTANQRPAAKPLPVAQLYTRYNIKFRPIERYAYHASIAVLDRVCRTTRDTHYNTAENPNGHKSSKIRLFDMIQLVKQRNTALRSAFYDLGSKLEEYNKANDI